MVKNKQIFRGNAKNTGSASGVLKAILHGGILIHP